MHLQTLCTPTNLGNSGKYLKDTFISASYSVYNDNGVMWLIINSNFIQPGS